MHRKSWLLCVYISSYRMCILSQVIVNMVALSPDGCTMITVETRLPEEGIGGLVCLKFWTSGSQNKDFSLSTVIYEPHRFYFIFDNIHLSSILLLSYKY